jgi:hypothetical protein
MLVWCIKEIRPMFEATLQGSRAQIMKEYLDFMLE